MDRPALTRRPPSTGAATRAERAPLQQLFLVGGDHVVGHRAKDLAVEPPDVYLIAAAQSRCGLYERLQNRLKVKGRAADHLEDFARRRLLLLGFRQALLQPSPGGVALARLACGGQFGFDARPRALSTPTHRPLLGSQTLRPRRDRRQSRRRRPRGQGGMAGRWLCSSAVGTLDRSLQPPTPR